MVFSNMSTLQKHVPFAAFQDWQNVVAEGQLLRAHLMYIQVNQHGLLDYISRFSPQLPQC